MYVCKFFNLVVTLRMFNFFVLVGNVTHNTEFSCISSHLDDS